MRVLVIDDEPGVRATALKVLRLAGAQVYLAKNAEDGWAAIQITGCYDVAVVDVVLPHVDGYQLADQIRRCCPKTRILMISGYLPTAIVERERTCGVNFLTKPFGAAELVAAVRRLAA